MEDKDALGQFHRDLNEQDFSARLCFTLCNITVVHALPLVAKCLAACLQADFWRPVVFMQV